MNIGELFVKLKADTSDFENGMKKAEKTATNTTGSMKSQAMKLAHQYKKEGMNMSDAMQKAWSEIERTSTDGTNNGSSNLSTFKAVIANNLNQIGQQMAQTGKQILSSIGNIVNTASEWSAQVEQQKFVYNNLDPIVQKSITSNQNLAESLGMTKQQYLNNSTSVSDFLQRMGMTGTEIANQSGKVTQLTADMAAFADVPVDEATSDFKSALVGNFNALDKYGVSVNVATINEGEYAKSLGKTWLKMTQAEKAQAILSETMDQSSSYTGLAQQEAGGFTMQMQQMKQRIMEATAAIGEKLFPVLEPLISKIIEVTKKLSEWVNEHPKLTQAILIVIGVIGGLMAVGGPLLMMFASLSTIALALNVSMLPMVGTIALVTAIIVGLIAVGVALWQNWDTIKAKAVEIWDSICDSISEAYENIKKWLNELDNSVNTFFSELPGNIANWLSTTLTNISTWCSDTLNTFITWCSDVITSIGEWFSKLPYNIGFALGTVLGTIASWGVNTYNYIITNVPIWINAIVKFFSELPGKIGTWLVNTYNKVVTWGSQMLSKAIETGTNFVNNIITFFAQLPGKIATWLTNTISKVASFVTQMGTKAKDAATQFTNNLVNGVKSIPSKMQTAGRNIVEGLWAGITGTGSWLKNKITGFANGIMDGFKKAFKIQSPSRLMRDEIGKFIPEGIAVGIDANADSVYNSLNNLASETVGTGSNYFGKNSILPSNASKNIIENKANTMSLNLKIENFNNNTDKDIEYLANELAFYLQRKKIALGGL